MLNPRQSLRLTARIDAFTAMLATPAGVDTYEYALIKSLGCVYSLFEVKILNVWEQDRDNAAGSVIVLHFAIPGLSAN